MQTLRRLCAILLLASPLVYGAGTLSPESIEGTTRIDAETLIDLLDSEDDLVIIDARIPADREGGYIEGAIFLPDTETTNAALAQNIPHKSNPVVFYCNGEKCGRSVKSAKMAVQAGYSRIYWFRGGWEEWLAKGLPVTK
ncbi:MAG: rhodanese-like domain-containing protein [Bermanella sp.]|jgi:Rhodanese-related sulfurtransferase